MLAEITQKSTSPVYFMQNRPDPESNGIIYRGKKYRMKGIERFVHRYQQARNHRFGIHRNFQKHESEVRDYLNGKPNSTNLPKFTTNPFEGKNELSAVLLDRTLLNIHRIDAEYKSLVVGSETITNSLLVKTREETERFESLVQLCEQQRIRINTMERRIVALELDKRDEDTDPDQVE